MSGERNNESDAAYQGLRLGVSIAQGTASATPELAELAQIKAPDLDHHDKAEVLNALHDLMVGPSVAPALEWLCESKILHQLMPEVAATVNFTQDEGRAHKDVWKHTVQVVGQAPAELTIRWAALLHDIGKVPTRATSDGGKVTFYGHAEIGARMFDKIARRLKFPKDLAAEIRWLIINHQRVSQYEDSWTDSAVRRFDRDLKPHLESLFKLSRADITSARQHKREAAWTRIDQLKTRINALREIDARVPPLPSGIGNLLMAHFSLKPSREIGKLKEALEAAIERGVLAPHEEPGVYIDYLEANESSLLAKLKEAK
jgi:poly(A) polymerase